MGWRRSKVFPFLSPWDPLPPCRPIPPRSHFASPPPKKKKSGKSHFTPEREATDRRLHMIRLVFAKETKVKRLGMFFPTPKRHGKKRERWYMPRQQMGVRFLWRRWKEALQVPERSPEYNFLATLYSLPVVVGDVGKLFPPGAVDRVGEPGVVRIELGAVGQDLKNRHAI